MILSTSTVKKMEANFLSQLINNVCLPVYLSIYLSIYLSSISSPLAAFILFSPDTKSRFHLSYLELSIYYLLLLIISFCSLKKKSYMSNYAFYSYMYTYSSS